MKKDELSFDSVVKAFGTSGFVVFVAAVGLITYYFMAATRLAQSAVDGGVPPLQLMQVDGVSVQEILNKPLGDEREYQYAVLPNGFRVLNVRDNRTLQTAFAVAVEAGQYADPQDLPGLAHFCEHMLFLGTEKYPQADGFDNFMSANGGFNNAYTADEVTVYFAEVSGGAAHEGLDRFADFFRAPLFDKKYVNKEVHAIDSEHAKNVQDPQRKVLQVLYSLADPRSPQSGFHTGNVDTLLKEPKKIGKDPVDELKEYFRLNYCPKRMTVVTVGSDDLKQQLKTVTGAFGKINEEGHSGCDPKKPSYAQPAPFTPDRMGQVVNIQGSNPQAELWLHFALPDLAEAYEYQPLQYIEYVLGYGGENSLSRVLQDNLGLVTSLQSMYDMSSAGTNMLMLMRLTPAGSKNMKLVCSVIFAYLAKLSHDGVDQALYNSIAKSTKLKWDWAEPSGPSDSASNLAEKMTRLPSAHLLTGDELIVKPNSSLVMSLIKKLTPSNMNVLYVDPDFGKSDTKGETTEVQELPYYNVKYSKQTAADVFKDAPDTWEKWLSGEVDAAGVRKALAAETKAAEKLSLAVTGTSYAVPPGQIQGVPDQVPLQNMHAAKDNQAAVELFGPRPSNSSVPAVQGGLYTKGRVKRHFLQERIALDSDASKSESLTGELPLEVWYRKGWVTTSPKAQFQLLLRVPRAPSDPPVSALDSVRLSLYSRLLAEEMEPKMVDLMAVGISYGVDVSPYGMTFTFSGFTPVMPLLIKKVLSEFNAFNANASIKASRYDRIVQEFKQELATYSDMPIHYALQDRNLLITDGPHSRDESLKALNEVNLASVSSSAGEVLMSKPLQLTALAMGNVAEDEARETIVNFVGQVKRPPGVSLQETSGEVERVTKVVDIDGPIEVRRTNPRKGDPNDAIVVSMLAGVVGVPRQVRLSLLGQILRPVAYNELRTNLQLGYVVSAGTAQASNVQYVSCVVQGNVLRADKVEVMIENVFQNLMPNRLKNLTDEEFHQYKDAFLQELQQPPAKFQDEVAHYWGPVSQGGRCFDLREKMLQYVNTSLVSKDALVEEWNRLIAPKGDGIRKKVVVKLFAGSVPPRPTESNMTAAWSEKGLSQDSIQLLQREHKRTEVLDRVDAATRERLVKKGGYFPTDLKCDSNED